MKYIPLFSFLIILLGCSNQPTTKETTKEQTDELYHYSIWAALVNKVYEGDLNVKEAKTHGDLGLGTYNGVDGELVLLDGIFYQVLSSGEVLIKNDSAHVAYLNATFFDKELFFEWNDKINYDSLRNLIRQQLPSRNFFYAIKIHGEFDTLKLGSFYKQERPYLETLGSLMPGRPTFDHTNISGTMVGFFCPDFIGDINAAGFHFHFLSDDKKTGGHVLEFSGKNFKVEMDKLGSYRFVLPETDDFNKANLDEKFQYGKK